jgi:transposase
MKHLTPENKQYMLRRHQEGASLRGIGREIGRPDITVRRTLEAMGVVLGPPKTTNRRSSPETEALVVRLYGEGCTWQQIIGQSGVTSVTVSKILGRNGHQFDRRSDADASAEIIATLYQAGRSTRAIGEMLGHGKSTVNGVITRHGGDMRPGTNPGCEYPDYFDNVDTPDKAYWLGFIAADGCIVSSKIHPEGDHLAIRLAAKDKNQLVKLKDAVGAGASVHNIWADSYGKRREYVVLQVRSRRLIEALVTLGLTPRKSATCEPWDGPADLMPHFWRGLVDGDGSLARNGKRKGRVVQLSGSEACVRAFAAWASAICGTNARPRFRANCWHFVAGGRRQVEELIRILYGDAPTSLDRKQAIADQVLAAQRA